MKRARPTLATFLVFALLTTMVGMIPASALAFEAGQRSGFPVVLSGKAIGFGSPTLADISGDGRLDIIVGGSDGYLYAVGSAGNVLWTFDVSAAIDARAQQLGLKPSVGRIPIRTAPAVGNLSGDSRPEIVVTAGEVFPVTAGAPTYNGGAVALNSQGQLLPGWPQLPTDRIGGGDPTNPGGPDGHSDGILSSPAIGDVTGDGVAEVAYGANDQYVYLKSPSGANMPGWPQWILDTVWSSPGIADIDDDGTKDLVIGVDAHFYRGPPRPSDDGGDLYVFRGDGSIIWRAFQDEIFQSTPAIADLDGDGKLEIAAGTGTFYGDIGRKNTQGGRVGQYFTVWNHDGTIRWRINLPERVFGSPAIGDVTGDSRLEVVVGVLDGKVYTFDGASGAILWTNTPRDIFNNQFLGKVEVYSPVLGDYNGDSRDDVFVAQGWDVVVLRGTDGAQFTGTTPTSNAPSYYGDYSVLGTPAVGDLDNDGLLEIVSASATNSGAPPFNPINGEVNVWEIAGSTAKASWPMFRGDAAHSGLRAPKVLRASSTSLGGLYTSGQSRSFEITVASNDGAAINWTANTSGLSNVAVTLSRSSGTQSDTLRVTIDPSGSGSFSGKLTLSASGYPSIEIPITGAVVDNVQEVFLPLQSN